MTSTAPVPITSWLRQGTYWKEINGSLVVFDVRRNKYLLVPDVAAVDLELPAESAGRASRVTSLLRKAKLLSKRPGPAPVICDIHSVQSSLLGRSAVVDLEPRVTRLVRGSARATTIDLICRGLAPALRRAVVFQGSRTFSKAEANDFCATAVSVYRGMRPFTFGAGFCLHESLTLLRLFSRFGVPSTLVFGVRHDTMAFHCWVQRDAMGVNDSVVHATAFDPLAAFSNQSAEG